MFIEPATSIRPCMGSPICCAICDRPPSAPMRYFARTSYSRPLRRSRTRAVTPSSSCSSERYSVEKRTCVPRACACLSMIGSSSVCGMSHIRVGLASV